MSTNQVWLHEMGAVTCARCVIKTRPEHVEVAQHLRRHTALTTDQAKTLETDMGETLILDQAFKAWGMDGLELALLDVAAANYCEHCGRRLDGFVRGGTVDHEG